MSIEAIALAIDGLRQIFMFDALHDQPDVFVESPEKKQFAVLDYNDTKGAVDTFDQMISYYSCACRTNRWPMRLFYFRIDTAGLNAFVAFSLANPGWQSTSTGTRKLDKRRLFLFAAGENLIQPLLAERASNMKICRRPSIARAMASIDMAHAYIVLL
jgi:hypothetical protein